MEERAIVLPSGVERPVRPEPGHVVVDNRTELPDGLVLDAVETHFVEHSSLLGANQGSTFQTYSTSNDGSLLARGKFKTPTNVYDEIRLARDFAERDDDVAATIGMCLSVAFGEGMENFHEDERTTALFNGVARHANLDSALKELYREYLIAGQVTSVCLYTREALDVDTRGGGEQVRLAAPLIGVLHAENIRLLGNDLFGQAELAYMPEANCKLARWLEEFFADTTTPARKAELRRQDPVSAALFTEQIPADELEEYGFTYATYVYRLNPRMVARCAMPKGEWPHPRPLLTRNFALLEAKRLLNIMDFALLQGGANFIVVAKKGDKDRPAQDAEIQNLTDVVRRASRSGVIVGDHRLSFEIITPDLSELLNPDKRKLLGRKLAMALLRLPEHATEQAGQEGVRADIEMLARVITGDRHDLKRHVEGRIYPEVVRRNKDELGKGAPKLWFPKIILQGSQYFTDFVLKLRDRGDIPRKFAVEAGGFDWEAGVAQRKRELDDDIDETMMPAAVPFSDPATGPQDNNQGRPSGSGPNNGAPNARPGPGADRAAPRRTITRSAGETVRAVREGDEIVRVGELTHAVLEHYPDAEVGRITSGERDALASREPVRNGPLAIVPVNVDYDVNELRAVRLAPGLSLFVGNRRGDNALVAKGLGFRQPEFDTLAAEETALRWGWYVQGWAYEGEVAQRELPDGQPIEVHVHVPNQPLVRRRILRDEHGNPTGTEEVPVEEGT